MSPCRLCAAPFPPVIVRIVDAPALPAVPEFEDKWPNFLDSPLPPIPHPSRSAKKQYYRLFPHQRAMPPTPPSSPRHFKPVRSDSTTPAHDLHALSPLSPMEQLFLVTPSSDTSSLSDPSIHSDEDDYDASGFPSWHNSYDFPATPSATPPPNSHWTSPPWGPHQSPRAPHRETLSTPPSLPANVPKLDHLSTSLDRVVQRAHVAPAFRHHATPPLPPPGFAPQGTIQPLHPSTYSTNTGPLSPSLPPSPLARAVPMPTSPVLTERSVFDYEEEGGKVLKGVKARFHKHSASSGAQGGRRKSAGEVVKGIFGGWSEKGGRGGKGT
ncbi:hypothetical protein VE04_10129 [Pseudogymnoascus sp. 24MN13]|nr:hypothetical protein VE04_10129 [Pseudogymnoascus sp. 24MN13]